MLHWLTPLFSITLPQTLKMSSRLSDPSTTTTTAANPPSSKYSSANIFKYTLLIIFLLVLLYLFYNWFLREDSRDAYGLEVINWIGPYEWAGMGIAAALGLSVIGAGW